MIEHGNSGLRTFVSIPLNPVAINTLSTFIESINKEDNSRIRWVKPEHFHITLNFLPKTDPTQLYSIFNKIQQAATTFSPFTLRLNTLGGFPNINSPRVLWASILGEVTTLKLLHNKIKAKLIPLGFLQERQKIVPHITLGRVPSSAIENASLLLKRIIPANFNFPTDDWYVTELHYIESTLTQIGPVYKTIGIAPLNKVI